MSEALRPILEISVVLPGLLLAYFPVKSYMKQPPAKLAAWLAPVILTLCVGGGLVCWHFRLSAEPVLALVAAAAIVLYIKTLRISLWEIRNDRAFRMRGVRLCEQPCPRA